ncbi:MAG TPA: GDP-mannose 4,6-dehydratase [Candidatus Moranbacteria bacterium]|nr:GDP-mannose 4,6-dehydratase [Candidatus Moranbacteria bacterium]
MNYKTILITGGAGFVGSNLALKLKKQYPDVKIISLDNLMRRGSELNLSRLKNAGVEFIHGDIRNKEDLLNLKDKIELIIECSAEPSVLAGTEGSPEYVINTNLIGTYNCLELARKDRADVVFMSTSRIYPVDGIAKLNFIEEETRFSIAPEQSVPGAAPKGFSEEFPLGKNRSFYGMTKLCSEFLINEYAAAYGIKAVINRCSVITGPWQMGKIDQGVAVLWVARHIWANKHLSYIGYGGSGKQVRDFIHIDDIFDVIKTEMEDMEKHNGEIYNIGGGLENSLSLLEMTKICQEITGHKLEIGSIAQDRPNDVKSYITDFSKFEKSTGWKPKKNVKETLTDVHQWIMENKEQLESILN